MSQEPDASGRRPRRRQQQPQQRKGPSVTTLVSVAAVAYGTYRLAHWAWTRWNDDDDTPPSSSQVPLVQQPHQQEETTQPQTPQTPQTPTRYAMSPHQWRCRRQRLIRCGDETTRAMMGLVPSLKRALEQATDVSCETRQLKLLRSSSAAAPATAEPDADAMRLWEIIKVRTMTRLIVTAYTQSILIVVVTVQIHLLGGKLLHEQLQQQQQQQQHLNSYDTTSTSTSTHTDASDVMDSYAKSHKLVLAHTYKYFLEQGVPALVQLVETIVTRELHDWNFSDPSSCLDMTCDMLEDALHRILRATPTAAAGAADHYQHHDHSTNTRQDLKSTIINHHHHPPEPFWLKFLLPPTTTNNNNNMAQQQRQQIEQEQEITDPLARWILDETWDLLESPLVSKAYSECLDVTLDTLKQQHCIPIFLGSQQPESFQSSLYPVLTTKSLPHVISKLNKHVTRNFWNINPSSSNLDQHQQHESSSPYMVFCQELQNLSSVMELADVSFG